MARIIKKMPQSRKPKQSKLGRARDKMRKAKPPGRRKSKSGRVYTERRKNRSDRAGKL